MRFEVIDETLPAYHDELVIKAYCAGVSRDEKSAHLQVGLRCQACDDAECYLPQELSFDLPVQVLSHDWEKI